LQKRQGRLWLARSKSDLDCWIKIRGLRQLDSAQARLRLSGRSARRLKTRAGGWRLGAQLMGGSGRASSAGRRQSAACGGGIAGVAVDGAPGPVRVRKTPGRERIAWGRRWRGRNGEEAAGACPSVAGCGHGASASNCRGTGAGERGEMRPGLPHHVAELRW